MLDIISDLENNLYFVREDGVDIEIFDTLEKAQNYINSI
jgi:hypothetical protein|tara:strand:- start:1457 stop:1573 length:117 start_codon:yes stop_codon:yes gene_type:complete